MQGEYDNRWWLRKIGLLADEWITRNDGWQNLKIWVTSQQYRRNPLDMEIDMMEGGFHSDGYYYR